MLPSVVDGQVRARVGGCVFWLKSLIYIYIYNGVFICFVFTIVTSITVNKTNHSYESDFTPFVHAV